MDNAEINALVRMELSDGEQLIWSDRPRQGVFLRLVDAFAIPFTVVWCGFAVFWTTAAASAAPLFALFGVPFVCVGLYIMVGRFFYDASQRARTAYAVTDRRLLVIRSGRSTSTTSIDLRQAGSIDVKEGPNGRGTISFGPAAGMPFPIPLPAGWPMGGATQRTQFDSIEDVRGVYKVIRDTSARSV